MINFFFTADKISLKDRTKLKAFVKKIFTKEGFKLGELTYVFCSDEYLLNINQQFLKHDFYTDIISFDLSSSPKYKDGEIYISTDRVRDNAKRLKTNFKNELHRVIFHGALHLCGYKDKKNIDIVKMRAAEDKYIALYFK